MKIVNETKLMSVLDFIREYQRKEGRSPSFRQIAKAVGFPSLATAQLYVKTLEQRDLIERNDFGKIITPTQLSKSDTIQAPLVGTVACGDPILAIENIEETYSLPTSIFGHQDLISLIAKGNSMTEVGIYDGDRVFYLPCESADEGEIVVALVDDSATIKTFYKRNGKVILHPENSKYKDIVVDDCKIRGIVKFVIHKF